MSTEKAIVILGPTSSGKTELSVKLAKKFKGEIISADSRQVYKGMDIGTGKVAKKEMKGIPHHLLDVASPKSRFTASQFKKLGEKALKQIQKKNKVPFIVGGTGFYIDVLLNNIALPEVSPDWKLRKKLEKQTVEELFSKLKELDPRRAKSIDKNNPRRLIRAIEIVLKTKKPVPEISYRPQQSVLYLGIKKPEKELKRLIRARLLKRLKSGMLNEAKKLRKSGVSWKRMEEFGLEYKYMALYLQKKLPYDEFVSRLNKEIEHYAKRQMTWFKKNKSIRWVKNYMEAEKIARKYLDRKNHTA